MKDYEVYLFDWDGTLANTTEIWVEAVHENLLRFGVVLPRAVILQSLGDFHDFLKHGLPIESLEAYHEGVHKKVNEHLPSAPLYEGAHDTLQALKRQGKKLAVVSACPRPIIDLMLEPHRLTDFFDVIVSKFDVKNPKPHPEGILLALEKLGKARKSHALMVGDNERDILAAEAAGVDTVLFSPTGAPYALETIVAKCRPTYVVRHWQEFAPHIAR